MPHRTQSTVKRQLAVEEKIFSNHTSDKGFVSRLHEDFLQLSNKKTNNLTEKCPWLDIVPNRTCCCCCLVVKSCLTLCDPIDCSTPGFSVLHCLSELVQIHVHWVGDAIQPFHPLSSPSPPAFNLSQRQDLFQWIGCLHQVAKVLELQLQIQPLQWIFRVDTQINKHIERCWTSLLGKSKSNHNEITPHTNRLGWLLTKGKKTSVGEDVEKLESLCTVDGNIKWYSLYGKSIAVSQKIKYTSTIWSSKSTSRYIFKRIESKISKKYLHTHVHKSLFHSSQEVKATQMAIKE